MKRSDGNLKTVCLPARAGTVLGLLFLLGLLLAAPASATYEQVDDFGTGNLAKAEEGQELNDPSGIAVNASGAGGVPAGSVYAVSKFGTAQHPGVVRFGPKGEFLGGWSKVDNLTAVAVAVDQTTGYVYVLTVYGKEVVRVYNADGSKLIATFGERGASGETVEEGPEKFHSTDSIAVDDSGTVYVGDADGEGGNRVMLFEPQSPGDYEHYVYTGRANDVHVIGSYAGHLALDSAGNIYTSNPYVVREYDPADPTTPVCEYESAAEGIEGMTVNPASGEVFYAETLKKKKIFQLGPCDPGLGEFVQTGSFTPSPVDIIEALAFNPALTWEASRPAGVLYGASAFRGYIFAPAEIHPPRVESQAVGAIADTSAQLSAQINPRGSKTRYAFQYIPEAAYEANEPNERQALTVSAMGGVFSLGFGGHGYGGEATATLSSGSETATSLRTAAGTATMKAGIGTATLKAGIGKGTVISGSTTLTALSTSEGAFEAGQQIEGPGIVKGTTIAAVKAGELTISKAATSSQANAEIKAGSTVLSSVSTSEGAFEAGQPIEGTGIPASTKITAAKAGQLTLSAPASKPGTGVAIKAGSTVLSSVVTTAGGFEAGQPISGAGIAAETTIVATEAGKLTISKPVSAPGAGVAIFSAGPAPLAVGERVEAPGIAAGTTILAAKAGQLTLSAPATASGEVTLHAGLPFDAPAARLRQALESLPAIGTANVKVSGGPGDEAGSSPYEVEFIGALTDIDEPPVEADGSGLSGGAAAATLATENDGGGGFAEGATEAPLGGSPLGDGQEALSAVASIAGLAPDTEYRYRAIATSNCDPEHPEALCEAIGPTQPFHTFPTEAPGLPDNRAYELVSPPRKHGGEVFPIDPRQGSCHECKPAAFTADRFPMQSAPSGEAVVYEGFPFSSTEGAARFDEYLARRTASGWQTTILSPTLLADLGGGLQAFDPELTQGLVYQSSPALTPEAPPGFANLYAQPTATPAALSPLLGSEPPNRPAGALRLAYAGASADLSHVFFAANDALTGETPFAPEAVDGGERTRTTSTSGPTAQLRLVNVAPGNAETAPGAVFGAGSEFLGLIGNPPDFSHAISEDGSRVFWSDEAGQVYVRIGGETTIAIPDPGRFLTAAADGSKVLLRRRPPL